MNVRWDKVYAPPLQKVKYDDSSGRDYDVMRSDKALCVALVLLVRARQVPNVHHSLCTPAPPSRQLSAWSLPTPLAGTSTCVTPCFGKCLCP